MATLVTLTCNIVRETESYELQVTSYICRYYRVMVEEQSILVFNNAGCLHHFTNVIEDGVTPIALSTRCKHAIGSDPRGWLHLAFDMKVWICEFRNL